MQWQGCKQVKWVKGLVLTCEIYKLDEDMHTVIVIESLTFVNIIVLFIIVLFPLSKFSF